MVAGYVASGCGVHPHRVGSAVFHAGEFFVLASPKPVDVENGVETSGFSFVALVLVACFFLFSIVFILCSIVFILFSICSFEVSLQKQAEHVTCNFPVERGWFGTIWRINKARGDSCLLRTSRAHVSFSSALSMLPDIHPQPLFPDGMFFSPHCYWLFLSAGSAVLPPVEELSAGKDQAKKGERERSGPAFRTRSSPPPQEFLIVLRCFVLSSRVVYCW